MAFYFKYPDTTSPTSTLEFSRGEFTGDVPYYVGNQESDESEYGEILTKSYGNNYRVFPLTVQVPIATQSGNLVDKTKLETFINTTVNFTKRPFYYTDSNGTSYKVKLVDKSLKCDRDYVSYRQYKLTLREVE